MPEINRRQMLKHAGAATSGFALVGSAQGKATQDSLGGVLIKVWPQKESDHAKAEIVEDTLDDFISQLQSADAIGFSAVNKSTKSTFNDGDVTGVEFNDCGPTNESYLDFQGDCYDIYEGDNYQNWDIHVLVSDETSFAGADTGGPFLDFSNGMTSLDRQGLGFAHVGTAGNYPGAKSNSDPVERMKNLSIQEVGHTLVDQRIVDDEDHHLGQIRAPTYPGHGPLEGPVTPMATFYENNESVSPGGCGMAENAADQGECDSLGGEVAWDGTHTQEITNCTIDAIRTTSQQTGYNE